MKEQDPFADGCRFQITLEVLPGDVSGVQRVRRWLRCSLRSFGLKNVSGLLPVKPDAKAKPIDAAKDADAGEAKPGALEGMPENVAGPSFLGIRA